MAWPRFSSILLEGVAVACLGALLGFAANSLSPRGLAIMRNYFPTGRPTTASATPAPTNSPPAATTNAATVLSNVIQRLEVKGLQHVDSAQAADLFRDPRREEGLILFIDARDDAHYLAGHIPGAYQFFHYRPEKYIETVLPLAQVAQQIVIYCTGGDCEDSEFAAIMLRDMGVNAQNLHVYVGGFTEWSTNGLPVEVGERLSGDIRNAEQNHAGQ